MRVDQHPLHLTLVAVTSADGFLTPAPAPGQELPSSVYSWSSPEDQDQFFSLIDQHNLIFMGRKTWEQNKAVIQLKPGKQRVVVTSNPNQYSAESVPGQLVFSDATPQSLVELYAQAGYTRGLVVGGSQLNAAFMNAGLIDEMLITREPLLFGAGTPLFGQKLAAEREAMFKLESTEVLNQIGTTLSSYVKAG